MSAAMFSPDDPAGPAFRAAIGARLGDFLDDACARLDRKSVV